MNAYKTPLKRSNQLQKMLLKMANYISLSKSFKLVDFVFTVTKHLRSAYINKGCWTALLQHGADPSIRNTEGKTAVEVAEGGPRAVLTGEHRKEELLEAARAGAEERLVALLTPLNVNCHASDGRRSTPLHLAAGYNRHRVVTLLLQHGADVHAKDKG